MPWQTVFLLRNVLCQAVILHFVSGIIECGHPGVPAHGSAIVYYNAVGYRCDAGYKLFGEHLLVCMSNGEWNGTIPYCHLIYQGNLYNNT